MKPKKKTKSTTWILSSTSTNPEGYKISYDPIRAPSFQKILKVLTEVVQEDYEGGKEHHRIFHYTLTKEVKS